MRQTLQMFRRVVRHKHQGAAGRVLALAEAYAARGTLVFVTHHVSEHLKCLTHVLHLVQDDAPVYCGARGGWNPNLT